MALLHRIADEGIFRLQVKDVELVDARRHQQEGAFIHLGREGLVFDELEQVVLKHHGAFGGGYVFAHLKHAFVRHGHMTLLHVMQQVLHAFGNAFAFGVDRFALRFGVECQEVAG